MMRGVIGGETSFETLDGSLALLMKRFVTFFVGLGSLTDRFHKIKKG